MANISSGGFIGNCISHWSFLSGKALCPVHAWHWTCRSTQHGTGRLDRRQYAMRTPNLPRWTTKKTNDIKEGNQSRFSVAESMNQVAKVMLEARNESDSAISTTAAFLEDFVRSEPNVLFRTFLPTLSHSRFIALKKRYPTYHTQEKLLFWLIRQREWNVPADHQNVALRLLWYMGANGYIPAAVWALQQNLHWAKRLQNSLDILATPVSKTLHKQLHEYNKSRAWMPPHALIIDGMALEANKQHDEATRVYKRAAFQPEQRISDKDNLSPTLSEREVSMRDTISELSSEENPIRPWKVLMEHLESKLQRLSVDAPERKNIFEGLRFTIAMGVGEDDAEAHYYMARVSHREYEFRLKHSGSQMRSELKSADWFFYMSKAAAALDPLAIVELGNFYWKSPLPYLDDAPTASAASAALAMERTPVQKLLYAIGIPGTEPAPFNVVQNVCLPRTKSQRLALAEDWFRLAVDMNYAPALRQLIEMYSQQHLTRELCEPDPWPESGPIDNPLYNPDKARLHMGNLSKALEARGIWLKLARNPETGRSKGHAMVAGEFFNATRAYSDPESIRRWTRLPRIFDLWVDNDKECQDMGQLYHRATR